MNEGKRTEATYPCIPAYFTPEGCWRSVDRGPNALSEEALQPNVILGGAPLSWRFYLLLTPAGIGAGIGAGLLMWLLRAAQHFFLVLPRG